MLNSSTDYGEREFHITILGRLLEHLGTQMYKQRAVAIAELVANSWDAGATNVKVELPRIEGFDRDKDTIVITDNGTGMTPDQVESEYLVLGRNRRQTDQGVHNGRPVMGRKGIGKLAGFGIARNMTLRTWQNHKSTEITLDLNELKADAGKSKTIPIVGTVNEIPTALVKMYESGTQITLSGLKHKTPLKPDDLTTSLGRRFSRRIRGQMTIHVNGEEVAQPAIDLEERFPEHDLESAELSDGNKVSYYYGFAKKVISSRELRGFTIYVRDKTAQAPPYFFDVEASAWGQHGTKYLTGEIYADYLDQGTDDDTDIISTDRQEIDWEDEFTTPLLRWGKTLTNKILRDRSTRKGEELQQSVFNNPQFRPRITNLDESSEKQIKKFLVELGKSEPDLERRDALADQLIKAYEYQHFHDVIGEIEDIGDDPMALDRLLTQLYKWKVLESRTILEIVKGRLDIIEKFGSMIRNNIPETAKAKGDDNLHDFLATYPWLIDPEWQVLTEETTISKQLADWNAEELVQELSDEDARQRYDFLALTGDDKLVIIEIKRSGHPVGFGELVRLDKYRENLSLGTAKSIYMLLICGGNLAVSASVKKSWDEREDGGIAKWGELYDRAVRYYNHYKAVLEGDIENPDFANKRREVVKTRSILNLGSSYRGREGRKEGLGSQDVDYSGSSPPESED